MVYSPPDAVSGFEPLDVLQSVYIIVLQVIGVKQEPQGIMAVRTNFGGTRTVDMLVGEQLPRIC